MPALNSMANQETRLNSGFSSSAPNRTFRYRPNASHAAKRRKPDIAPTYNHPKVALIQSRNPVKLVSNFSCGNRKHTATNAKSTTAAAGKTTQCISKCLPILITGSDGVASLSRPSCGFTESCPSPAVGYRDMRVASVTFETERRPKPNARLHLRRSNVPGPFSFGRDSRKRCHRSATTRVLPSS